MTARQLHIVVTGASSGIGRAIATALARDGHAVYACARRQAKLDKLAAEVPLALSQRCDVADEKEVQAFMRAVEARTPHIDALFTAAGAFGAIGPVSRVSSAEWVGTLQVNLFGTFYCVKHALPLMVKGIADRRIITFAGGGAFNPLPHYSAYATSKSAVVRLSETLAEELATQGITVNCMAPGFVTTEIHEATLQVGPDLAGQLMYQHTRKKLQAGSVPIRLVVECARYLVSDRAAGLTGKTISVSFDPWDTPAFNERVAELNKSDLYTGRRINLVNVAMDPLRQGLEEAAAAIKLAGLRSLTPRADTE